MPLAAKQLGNTGSTNANRVVWNFNLSGESDDMALGTNPELQLSNSHTIGNPFNAKYSLSKIMTVHVYGTSRIEMRLPFTPNLYSGAPNYHEVVGFFEPGFHDFSNLGGLPLCIQRPSVFGIPNTPEPFRSPQGRFRAIGDLITLTNMIDETIPIGDSVEYNVMRCFAGASIDLDHGVPLGCIVEFRI